MMLSTLALVGCGGGSSSESGEAPDTDTDFINEDGDLILEFLGFKLVFEKQQSYRG